MVFIASNRRSVFGKRLKSTSILVALALFIVCIVILNIAYLGKVAATAEALFDVANGNGSSSSEKTIISPTKLREEIHKATPEAATNENQGIPSQTTEEHREIHNSTKETVTNEHQNTTSQTSEQQGEIHNATPDAVPNENQDTTSQTSDQQPVMVNAMPETAINEHQNTTSQNTDQQQEIPNATPETAANENQNATSQTLDQQRQIHNATPAFTNENQNSTGTLGQEAEISNATPETVTKENQDTTPQNLDQHRVAGLKCDKYGGPSQEIAQEMVYWRDIPSDAQFESPYARYGKSPKYLTFEPDEGGWNNIRMSMETATVLAHAMGRILVLPPEQNMYLLWNDHRNNRFTFKDFFHFDSIAEEHPAVEVISMPEFLQREAITGHLLNRYTGEISFPPDNQTVFEGGREGRQYWLWLRNATMAPIWSFDHCVAAFPSVPGPEGVEHMKGLDASIDGGNHIKEFFDNPTDVDAPAEARMREILGTRKRLCVYDDTLQNAKVVHFMGDNDSGARLLVHFYAFLFFEDFHQDLWTKRFVRDHLRYIDEIQCAAARVVHAVRQKAIENGSPDGIYDSFHIRRGDFQYKETRISAEQIYENTKDILEPNSTIFIATDEKDASFFDPLRQHYKLLFLNDFKDLIEDVNKNYMGMLDQRIASRGRTFVGAYFSTFTGYINRMRGYHSMKDKLPGWEKGEINSYFYVPMEHKLDMRKYNGIHQPMWGREFPVGWRDIDHDLPPDAFSSTM